MQEKTVGALVLAAGRSQRMQGIDKTFAPVLGKPLILHTLSVFLDCPDIQEITLVMPKTNMERGRKLLKEHGIANRVNLCSGGDRRQDSAARGLDALGPCDLVAVHDGARPCLSPDILHNALADARKHGNAVVAVPITDTMKRVDSEGYISGAVSRESLWAMQTPQVFPYEALQRAYRKVSQDVTDDASMVQQMGVKVRLIPGSPTNLKVTTPADLELTEIILRSRAGDLSG